jgi:hypothetical protein
VHDVIFSYWEYYDNEEYNDEIRALCTDIGTAPGHTSAAASAAKNIKPLLTLIILSNIPVADMPHFTFHYS